MWYNTAFSALFHSHLCHRWGPRPRAGPGVSWESGAQYLRGEWQYQVYKCCVVLTVQYYEWILVSSEMNENIGKQQINTKHCHLVTEKKPYVCTGHQKQVNIFLA